MVAGRVAGAGSLVLRRRKRGAGRRVQRRLHGGRSWVDLPGAWPAMFFALRRRRGHGPRDLRRREQHSGDGCSSSCEREGPCFAVDGSPTACPASCGNGRIDGSEECDDGSPNADAVGACSTTCHRLRCGDGIVTPPETCDLGPNNAAWTYVPASSACTALCTTPRAMNVSAPRLRRAVRPGKLERKAGAEQRRPGLRPLRHPLCQFVVGC